MKMNRLIGMSGGPVGSGPIVAELHFNFLEYLIAP